MQSLYVCFSIHTAVHVILMNSTLITCNLPVLCFFYAGQERERMEVFMYIVVTVPREDIAGLMLSWLGTVTHLLKVRKQQTCMRTFHTWSLAK